MSAVVSLENAIKNAVTVAGGSIPLDEANAILVSHKVDDGYLTVVIDEEMGVEDDYFVDLVFDGATVTGIRIEQDFGQHL